MTLTWTQLKDIIEREVLHDESIIVYDQKRGEYYPLDDVIEIVEDPEGIVSPGQIFLVINKD